MHKRASFSTFHIPALLLGSVSLLACQSQSQIPEAKSAAGQSGYAETYPSRLEEGASRVQAEETEVSNAQTEFASYPDQLKKTDYEAAKKVYELANEDGKSARYAKAAEDAETVSSFYVEQKDDLSKQVAGSARYAAKDKGATDEQADAAASGASFGLEKALTKQIEASLKEASEAIRFIEDHEEELGKANGETLAKQAQAISHASYVVNVQAPKAKAKLEKLVAEAGDVKKTLDKSIEEANKVEADPATSAKRKKAAKARSDAASEARAKVDAAEESAKTQLKDLEQKNKALKDTYEKAFSELVKKTEEKAASEPKK